MTVATGLMMYLIFWWLAFFMVLPVGVRSPEEAGEKVMPGNADSAPPRPRLWLKVGIATAGAGVLWLIFYWMVALDPFGLGKFIRP